MSVVGQVAQFQMSTVADNARNAALGGEVISLNDGDITQFQQNPALLDSVAAGSVAFTYSPYFADIHSFSGSYYGSVGALGKLAFGIKYFDFGSFERREPNGDLTGDFSAMDYQIIVGKSHRISSFVFGVNAKFTSATIDAYQSNVMLFDMGGLYQHPQKELTFAITFSDFGFVMNDFLAVNSSQVPFDVKIGTTFKPMHMPFRFSVTAHHLANNDLIDDNPDNGILRINDRVDNILKRIGFGAELLLSDNVQILMGYNHLKRQELSVLDNAGGAGLSFGFLVGIKRFQFRYAYSRYHFGGGANFFTLQSNIHSFTK